MVLACAKLLEFCEVLWLSGDRLVHFVVVGVSFAEINGFSVVVIGMEIVDVWNDLFGIIREVCCNCNDSVSMSFSFA